MVATPMATYYPLLDITGRDVVDMAAPIVVEEASKPASTDAKTIMVDKDEAWEAEYLKAMEEMVSLLWGELSLVCANEGIGVHEQRTHVGQDEEVQLRECEDGKEVFRLLQWIMNSRIYGTLLRFTGVEVSQTSHC
jgi:hypothetical protein